MTETESKIVQLLKSDEDYNKILGLMLGRNELGVERLLNLFESNIHRGDDDSVSEIKIRNIDIYIYTIYRNLNWYRFYKNYNTICEDDDIGLNSFNEFLKLTIDDVRIQPTT